MVGDIRLGLKMLRKDRTYAGTAIVTLAICFGANTGLFTIVNAVLLKPLPVPESDRILLMSNQYPNAGSAGADGYVNSGAPDYYDRLRALTVVEEQAMYNSTNESFDMHGEAELIHGLAATPSLFRLLRVAPALGRIFDETEAEIGNEQKIILSYGLCQQLFGEPPRAIGHQIHLSGRPFTIVGVMSREFQFADPDARFWIPLAFTPQQRSDEARHINDWYNVARLKRDATIQQAQAQVNAVNAANRERLPQFKQFLTDAGFHTRVEPLQDVLVRSIRPTLYLLWGGAIFVLLIGGLNISNLALARSGVRAREVAIRLALGAGRGRVARQLIVEGLLLSFAAGALGLVIGSGILEALRAIGLERLPRANEIHIDYSVISAAFALSGVVGILIGLVPAVYLFNRNLLGMLRDEGRTGTIGRGGRTARRALVVAQLAFAFVLLVGAGLLLASFRKLLTVDPGFKAEHVITAAINMPLSRYGTDNDVRAFTNRALQTVRSVPGVIQAGGTTIIPLGGNHTDSVILAEGYQMKPGESVVSPMQVVITPGYLQAMNTSLLRGRFFDDRDNDTAPGVVIVDERLAQKFWPGRDSIGRRMYEPSNLQELLRIDEHTRWLTVVGVVREVQMEDLAGRPNGAGTYYFAAAQVAPRGLVLAIETAMDPASVFRMIRTSLNRIDPAMPLSDVRTMDERTARSLIPRRAALLLALSFGLVATLLSAIGIYGVLVYLVTQRTREIGIRLALGSTARGVFGLVLREGLVLVAGGLTVGLAGTIALRRVLQSQVYGIGATDPMVIGLVFATLGAIALVACSLPALHATRVNPVTILSN